MKKAIIAIVSLLIATGISIGAFIMVKSKSDKEEKKEETTLADNVLFDFDSANINKVEISCPDGKYTIELNNEIWEITDSTDTPFDLNQVTIQSMCTFSSDLKAVESYGSLTDENKATYGLDNPYVLTLSGDAESYTLYLGNKSATGDVYYGYTGTKNNIYAIPSSIVSNIITTRLGLKDNNFQPYATEEIIGLELVRNGETVYTLDFNAETNKWELPEKYDMLTIDQTKVTGILTILTRLTAEIMLPEAEDDIQTYGFDQPIAEFTIKASDGTEKTLLFSKYGQDAATYTYVYNQEAKQVETYYAYDLDFIDKVPADFIMKNIQCASLYSVKEFEITSKDLNVAYSVNATEGWAESGENKADLTNATVLSYFENFFNQLAYIAIDSIDVESTPELENPVFSVEFLDVNDKQTQLDFVKSDNDQLCFIFINGEYTGTLTSTDFLTADDSVFEAYKLFCKQAGIN